MNRRDELIEQLNVKVDMLTQRYAALQERQQIVDALKEENALLRQQYKSLKLAKTISLSEGDVRQARLQLSQLISQIDKCIAMLLQ